jgi:Zn-dependent peptidase ImmA (M78 family)/transcriptional regulator with XRE-family HTH domain
MTQSTLAQRAGVARETLSRWEAQSVVQLDDDTCSRLAVALDFPREFLARELASEPATGSLQFRARRSMPKKHTVALARRAELVHDVVCALEQRVSWRAWDLPSLEDVDVVEAAVAVRDYLKIESTEPIGHLTRAAETMGAVLVALDWREDSGAEAVQESPSVRAGRRAHHDAFSTWIGGDLGRPLIATSRATSWDRTRWSIAHELGHIALHRGQLSEPSIGLEMEANEFACELLCPIAVLRPCLNDTTSLEDIVGIKLRMGMSVQATIEHAWRNELISDRRRTSLYKQLSNRGWRTSEPGHNQVAIERPRALAKLLDVIYGRRPPLSRLSAVVGFWPVDALAETLRTQTSAPSAGVSRVASGVVELDPVRRQRYTAVPQ